MTVHSSLRSLTQQTPRNPCGPPGSATLSPRRAGGPCPEKALECWPHPPSRLQFSLAHSKAKFRGPLICVSLSHKCQAGGTKANNED